MTPLRRFAWTVFMVSCGLVAPHDACAQAANDAVLLPNAPAATGVTPQLGAQLPRSLRFVNTQGAVVPLGSYFDGRRPVVMVPGYASCITLCGVAMQNMLRTLAATGLQASAYRLLSISIDPDERADMARARERGWRTQVTMLNPPPALPEALIGEPASVAATMSAMGIHVSRMAEGSSPHLIDGNEKPAFAHPAVAVIATPDGRITGYISTLDHDAAALRQALVAASNGELGSPKLSGPIERFVLRCAHLDSLSGRHTAVVLRGFQAMGLALTAWLGSWLWRHRRGLGARGAAP